MVNLSAGADGTEKNLPVVWYASASGFQYSGQFNQRMLQNAVVQALSSHLILNRSINTRGGISNEDECIERIAMVAFMCLGVAVKDFHNMMSARRL